MENESNLEEKVIITVPPNASKHEKRKRRILIETDNPSPTKVQKVAMEKDKCNICIVTFAQSANLKKHIASVHEKKITHKCSICDTSFSRSSSLKSHTESVHEKKKDTNAAFVMPVFQEVAI